MFVLIGNPSNNILTYTMWSCIKLLLKLFSITLSQNDSLSPGNTISLSSIKRIGQHIKHRGPQAGALQIQCVIAKFKHHLPALANAYIEWPTSRYLHLVLCTRLWCGAGTRPNQWRVLSFFEVVWSKTQPCHKALGQIWSSKMKIKKITQLHYKRENYILIQKKTVSKLN